MDYFVCVLTNRLSCRSAHSSSRGGFTLVELLVVIGIIAILAGVAFGPITGALKKAKENAGMQTGRSIGLAEFAFSNDNNQQYPDQNVPTSGGATDASVVARALLAGNYISDPTLFFITGDQGGATKFTGTNASTTIAKTNISYDFAGAPGGNGLSTNTPDQCPVLWSSLSAGTQMSPLTVAANSSMEGVPGVNSPYGTDGIVIVYHSNSSFFKVSTAAGGTPTVTVVSNASQPFTITVLAGQ